MRAAIANQQEQVFQPQMVVERSDT